MLRSTDGVQGTAAESESPYRVDGAARVKLGTMARAAALSMEGAMSKRVLIVKTMSIRWKEWDEKRSNGGDGLPRRRLHTIKLFDALARVNYGKARRPSRQIVFFIARPLGLAAKS